MATQRKLGDYKRIVVKAGTNVLTGGGDQLALELMASIVDQISDLRRRGLEILLVTSGAIAAGTQVLDLGSKRKDIPSRQALAAVGQSRLMHTYEGLFDKNNLTIAQ